MKYGGLRVGTMGTRTARMLEPYLPAQFSRGASRQLAKPLLQRTARFAGLGNFGSLDPYEKHKR